MKINIKDKESNQDDFIHTKYGYCFYWVSYNNDSAWIYNLHIYKKYRRKGYAKKLIKFIINEIRNMGFDGEIEVYPDPKENSITKENLSLFYEKMGLKIIL